MKGEANMKSLFISLTVVMVFSLSPILSYAQDDQSTQGSAIAQPLVREGTLASALADALKLGAAADEVEAESLLSGAGIAPRNGWIADYPVTPDIVGELQDSVGQAADAGKLPMGRDDALKILQDVLNEYNLMVEGASGQVPADASAPVYPDATALSSYYYDEGPPVVTYYAPLPDYAYLYSWVPYPFWWSNFLFSGFYVLNDFDVRERDHRRDHDHDQGRGEFISNHFHDSGTGRMMRIDPANRSHSGVFQAGRGTGWSTPAARSNAEAVFNGARQRSGGGEVRGFRGYGVTTPSPGAGSTVFEHSENRPFEHAASDRGFQSRSSAGQLPAMRSVPRGGYNQSGGNRAFGGFHGGGEIRRGRNR
jgi:hypothetical protein